MALQAINSEKDYSNALKEIEKLWGANKHTLAGNRLDVLISLVEAYEQAHHFVDIPNPLDAKQFRWEQMGADPR